MEEPDPRKMKSSIYRIWKKRKEKREERLRLLEETIPEYEEFERGIEAQRLAWSPKEKAVRYGDEDEEEQQEEPCPCPALNSTHVDRGRFPEAIEQRVQDDDEDDEYYDDSLMAQYGEYDDSLEGPVADYYEDDSLEQGPVIYEGEDQYDSLEEQDDEEYDSLEERIFDEAFDSLDRGPLSRGAAEVGMEEDSLEEFKAAVDRVIDMASAILESQGGEEQEEEEEEEEEEDEEEEDEDEDEEDVDEEDESPYPEDLQEFRIHQEPERNTRVRFVPVTLRQQPGFWLQQQGQREPRFQFPQAGQQHEYPYAEGMQPFWLHDNQRYRRSPSPPGIEECPCDEHQQGFWLH